MRRNKKDRTGETSVANNGMKMTIIAYRTALDIDVQFEDGAIAKKKVYQCFKKGNIRHPDNINRIGKTNKNKNGMIMTIIAYRTARDIDVQFEDGAIRKNVQYSAFKKGNISHPNELKTNLNQTRIGKTATATNGMAITIIAYRGANDIDVQFEDGAVRNGLTYTNFKKGTVKHPNDLDRVGETTVASNNMKITIIAYQNNKDIDVQFEDGAILKHTAYRYFKHGKISHPCFPMRGKGTYKTFETQYAYTTPDGSVYFYCECQECGLKMNLTARELINLNHTCENIEGSKN